MSETKAIPADARLLLKALRAFVRTQQISERADVRCCGMTVAQAATLHVLHLEGPMRLGALGRRLGIAASTLTRNVERLEERGLVARGPDPEDGRAFRLRLTAAGSRGARELEDGNEQFAARLLDSLPPTRRKRAVEGLLDLLQAIDTLTGPCCPDAFKPTREFMQEVRP